MPERSARPLGTRVDDGDFTGLEERARRERTSVADLNGSVGANDLNLVLINPGGGRP
ncbi:MAG: hypothetical protein IBJ11_08440 [Phycisphaerales bacterium]|nr:hypothetical protein [Phycisphaerales bacterium]